MSTEFVLLLHCLVADTVYRRNMDLVFDFGAVSLDYWILRSIAVDWWCFCNRCGSVLATAYTDRARSLQISLTFQSLCSCSVGSCMHFLSTEMNRVLREWKQLSKFDMDLNRKQSPKRKFERFCQHSPSNLCLQPRSNFMSTPWACSVTVVSSKIHTQPFK